MLQLFAGPGIDFLLAAAARLAVDNGIRLADFKRGASDAWKVAKHGKKKAN